MSNLIKRFLKEEDGMGVIEIVVIVGVLVIVALLFSGEIQKFAKGLMDDIFKVENASPTKTEGGEGG